MNDKIRIGYPQPPTKAREQRVCSYDRFPEAVVSPHHVPRFLGGRLMSASDGRKLIERPDHWPFSIHGKIDVSFGDYNYYGSGVMIGPHHFLTAAHCVFKDGEWASNVRVTLALHNSFAPFGEVCGTQIYSFNEYIVDKQEEWDVALVLLDRSIGYYSGWSGLDDSSNPYLRGMVFQVTGYPSDKKHGNQIYTMKDKLHSIEDDILKYLHDTAPGQSGGAIWYIDRNDQPFCIGIHSAALLTINQGVKLSRSNKRELLLNWIKDTYVLQSHSSAIIYDERNDNITILTAAVKSAAAAVKRLEEKVLNSYPPMNSYNGGNMNLTYSSPICGGYVSTPIGMALVTPLGLQFNPMSPPIPFGTIVNTQFGYKTVTPFGLSP
jgi:V8-like Glu-specific endopeptidase